MNLPIPPAVRWHPGCIACGLNPAGLNLRFEVEDGRATTRIGCSARYQGYPGVLHGGVTATVVDATMTQCLFARGIVAYTAKLDLRYRLPIRIGSEAVVRAWVTGERHPAYELEAEVLVEGARCASAKSLFMVPADGILDSANAKTEG